MTNEIKKIETGQLDEVVTHSGLALQEGDEIKKSYLPFIVQLAETQAQADKINFNNPTELDENIARELRLKTVKIRTGAEKLKDDRKRMYLLRGNLEQAAYKVIDASCRITEEVFINVEKAREIAEKKRQEVLRVEREEKLRPYTEDAAMYPLGLMKDDAFEALYTSLRTAQETRIAAEKKAEADRIKREKADAKAREEQRLENIRLRKEAEEKDRLAEIERVKNAAILKAQQEKADKERMELLAKANAERIEKARLVEIERKKDAKLFAEQVAKADKERKEKERLLSEAKAMETKLAAEKKAKLAEEKAAKLVPDKVKLLSLALSIEEIQRPEIKSIEAAPLMANINGLIIKLVNYIRENADKL
jgi:hypothetical protein